MKPSVPIQADQVPAKSGSSHPEPFRSRMCAGFKAGDCNAHHLVNRSDRAARFLVVGTRVPGDHAHYPDDDLAWFRTEAGTVAVHKDGTPWPKG